MRPDLGVGNPPPTEIGRRHSIRLKTSDGARDLLGTLTAPTEITKKDGSVHSFDPTQILAWRVIEELTRQAGKGAPASLRIAELEALSTTTWPASEIVARGGWLYRTSDGYNFRSNSVLITGDPEFADPVLPLDEELDFLIAYFGTRKLTPTIALTLPRFETLDQILEAKGWQIAIDAQMMVADKSAISLGHFPSGSPGSQAPYSVKHFDHPAPLFQEIRENSKALEVMSSYPASYICLVDHDGVGFAAGRIATLDDWAIVTAIFIKPTHRGKNWSRVLMKEVLDRTAANKIALQVDSSNHVALHLYTSLGFRKHHDYRFRTWGQRNS